MQEIVISTVGYQILASKLEFYPPLILTLSGGCSVEENVIEVKDIDAFDGPPVLDLKGDFFGFNQR